MAASEIAILKREDGSDWLLREEQYCKMYKALKGGVQVCCSPWE